LIFQKVLEERVRQNAKFGVQNWPIIEAKLDTYRRCEDLEIPNENRAKQLLEAALRNPNFGLTWSHILLEEFAEMVCEDDQEKQLTEIFQVIAVSVAMAQQILRNRASFIEGESN
jgi:hypothetical protein